MLSDVARSVVRYTDSTLTSSGPSEGKVLRQRLVQLENAHGTPVDKTLRCSLLNLALPRGNVIGAHLAKRSWHGFVKSLLGFDDVHDVRNGLLLHKSIEWAFDTSRLVFVWDASHGSLTARVLDPSILGELLSDKAATLLGVRYTSDVETLAGRTFRDVNGLSLVTRHAPFRRCLCMHAHLAREEAVRQGWLQNASEFSFDDFWSEAGGVHERVLAWLRQPHMGEAGESDAGEEDEEEGGAE